jgi:tetratricopeptide (TPR) repeat protein
MALRRHQTLRAALEWSHSLLTDEERKVFRRLSVFAGGFALELAQAVAADDSTDRWQVVDLLGHLIDKSLVVSDHAPVPRYRLLETTRAFALESLANAGETAALLRRHAEALTADLAAHDAVYWTQKWSEAERMPRELDNLRAALDWAESADGDRTLAIELLGVSYGVWHSSGQLMEGIERCRRALPLPAGLPVDVEARFWLAHGRLGYVGARVDCYDAAGRAADLFRGLKDHRRLVDALLARALIGARRGCHDAAAEALAEAESLVTPHWPAKQRAVFALAQAIWLMGFGRHEEAMAALLRQAACYREEGLDFGVQLALSSAGFQEACLGRYDAGIARLSQAARELRQMNARFGVGDAVGYLSFAYALRGGPGDASRALSLAADAWPELQRSQRPVWLLLSTAHAQMQLGQAAAAARVLGKVDALRIEEGVIWSPFLEELGAGVDRSTAAELGAELNAVLKAEGAALSDDAAAALAFTDAGRAGGGGQVPG